MNPLFPFRTIFLLLFLIFFSASETYALKIFGFKTKDHDVVFIASPISTKEMTARQPVDAIEASNDTVPKHVVIFEIERVLIGEIPKEKLGGPSKWDQFESAKKNKDYLNLMSLNFKDPDALVDKELFRIAVQDAGETFGLTPGEPVPNNRFKIYLKRVPKQSQNFLFVKRELLN